MASESRGDHGGFTFDLVVEILAMLDGSDLPTRIVYEDGSLRLEIERGVPRGAVSMHRADSSAAASQPTSAAESRADAPAFTREADDESRAPVSRAEARESEPRGEPVRAPITGIFYRAPNPGAAPFVEVGQRVSPDDTIGIIEVMKVMNTMCAGIAGTVVEICVENAQLVEFEQVLVRIEPET
jgi:acetyl-CoA carboxylase biotin carboxyl carrier protein